MPSAAKLKRELEAKLHETELIRVELAALGSERVADASTGLLTDRIANERLTDAERGETESRPMTNCADDVADAAVSRSEPPGGPPEAPGVSVPLERPEMAAPSEKHTDVVEVVTAGSDATDFAEVSVCTHDAIASMSVGAL